MVFIRVSVNVKTARAFCIETDKNVFAKQAFLRTYRATRLYQTCSVLDHEANLS